MIHNTVLFSFIISISTILFEFHKVSYAWFILFCAIPIILFRIFFHSKRVLLTVLFFILLGVGIQNYIEYKIKKENIEYNSGFIYKDKQSLELQGKVNSFPSYRYSNNQYVVSLANTQTRILVYTQSHQKLSYLEHLTLTVSVQDVREQGQEWQKYYQKLGVHYIVWYPSTLKISQVQPVSFNEKFLYRIFIFKTRVRNLVIEKFSSHASALILGMLLGEKDELSKEEKELFNNANLSHILVVSGYNISIVISFVFLLLQNFSRYFKTMFAILFVLVFVLLVGLDASVVRSALMGSIVILGKILYRQSSGVHTLFLVGLCMLIYNPFSIFDAGFHLSFLATYSLLILPNFKKIPEYILTTIWVFVWVSVYILYLSGGTSLVGIFTNIFVLLTVPVFMAIAGISLAFSFLNIQILFDVFILEILSRYIFFIAHVSQYAPRFEYVMSAQICAGIYVTLLSSICFNQNKYTTKEFIEKYYQKFVPQKPN